MPNQPLDVKQLTHISDTTLAHYEERADAFWDGTKHHDVTQNYNALLRHIAAPAPLQLLDFGCGPGRDLVAFKRLGHAPTGLDGSKTFCAMARKVSGCPVFHQDFLKLNLPREHFDGVFANASLFHVPTQELPRVLEALHETLRPLGVLFASNPRGDNTEGWSGRRYGAYHDLEAWRQTVTTHGFEELEHYYRPEGLPQSEQPWLATVFRQRS